MDDVERRFPLTQRRNYMHRARLTKALQDLNVVEHYFPKDFFRRHWRDQQTYIERVLGLNFCPRCKLPVLELEGMLCAPCADSNERSWRSTQAYKQREIERSLKDQPVIAPDIMDGFQRRDQLSKVQRFARDYEVSLEDAKSILEPEKDAPTVADILAKARNQS
jgi:hypothetical protein